MKLLVIAKPAMLHVESDINFELAELSELLAQKMGMSFSKNRWQDMERGIKAASHELGFKDVQSCIKGLLTSSFTKIELEILASHLTVGETYFFREPKSFEALDKYILRELIDKRRGKNQILRIWSAGCATGEEAYSIAMLLDKMLIDIDDWNITILATDINPHFLMKAAKGIYSEWSFRGVPEQIKKQYFNSLADGHFSIVPKIKQMVKFSYLNFADDTYPSLSNGTNAMDIIFCRNVMMYFNQPLVTSVIERLRRCLLDEGFLSVSSVETSHLLFSTFEPIRVYGLTFYKKSVENKKASTFNKEQTPAFNLENINLPPVEKSVAAVKSIPASPDPAPIQKVATIVQTSEPEKERYEKAKALFHTGQYAEAIEKLTSLLDQKPYDIQTVELLVRSLANHGQLASAIEWCEKAVSQNNLNADIHYLLATIQQETDQIDDATASFKRSLYLDPDRVLAYFALGNLFRAQGKNKLSTKHYENALKLLDRYQPEDVLPESDGMTARRLREIIQIVSANHGESE